MRKLTKYFVGTIVLFLSASALAGPAAGDADYPPEALRRHDQGQTLVDLRVGANGRVTQCTIVVSSASGGLDAETCRQFTLAARFTPTQDEQGHPVESHALGKYTWVIPGCPAPRQTDARLKQDIPLQATITSLEHC